MTYIPSSAASAATFSLRILNPKLRSSTVSSKCLATLYLFGVSRPTYYQAKASFQEAGIAGLVPRKRGPRGPHKLQGEVLTFLEGRIVPGEPIRARELSRLIRKEFGLDVHPRTIERAVRVKKTPR